LKWLARIVYDAEMARLNSPWRIGATAIVALLATGAAARATIINGDFEDGLTGWTVVDGNWIVLPGSGGQHFAVSDVGGFIQQDFLIPAGAQTLELDYALIQSGPGGTQGPTDFVSMYLVDPGTADSLIPPAAGFEFTNLFLNETQNGVGAVNPDYVTITFGGGANPDHVSVDLSHLITGQAARIAFQFSDNLHDQLDSLLAVDNVLITVPEPGCGCLALLASALLLGRRK
jgi:hypothetical protein